MTKAQRGFPLLASGSDATLSFLACNWLGQATFKSLIYDTSHYRTMRHRKARAFYCGTARSPGMIESSVPAMNSFSVRVYPTQEFSLLFLVVVVVVLGCSSPRFPIQNSLGCIIRPSIKRRYSLNCAQRRTNLEWWGRSALNIQFIEALDLASYFCV